MTGRLDFFTDNPLAQNVIKHITAASATVTSSTLPIATLELVRIRASQINGCAFCLDMHTKDAAAAGETAMRLHLVAAWREATVFSEAERAALELTEQGPRIAAGESVTDEAWTAATMHYDEEQLTALVAQIALINAFNKLNVMTEQPSIDYQPGQFG